MASLASFESVSTDFPNYLASPQPEQRQLRSSRWLLLLLVTLCLLPRAVIALHVPCIAGDGVNYVNAARALEAGDFHAALWEGGINIYPVILTLLHRVGLDWELAAILWGVIISSLVILPLWGWVRRQFDDRVAVAACLLYIVHPKFITESPELMRDPTFWFFFTLAIYALWRAVTEVRYGYFIAAGVAITLASLTRIEGLFLLIPLFLWSFWRWLALETGRQKLLVGVVLCVAAFPLLLTLVNVIWLSGHSDWAMIRLSPLTRAQMWLESIFTSEVPADGNGTAAPPRIGLIVWRFFPTMARGLSPVFALLMFGGIWGWRRTWARRDHQVLFYTTITLLCGVWVQSWANWYLKGNINARYALPIVLMAAPFAALGLLGLTARVLRLVGNGGQYVRRQYAAVVVLTMLVVTPTVAAVLHNTLSNYGIRRTANEVGHWLRQEFSAPPMILAPWDVVLPISYYSGSNSHASFRYNDSDAAILESVARNKADVVLLQPSGDLTPKRCESLVDQLKRMGFESVRTGILSDTDDDCHVLVRTDRLDVTRRSTYK